MVNWRSIRNRLCLLCMAFFLSANTFAQSVSPDSDKVLFRGVCFPDVTADGVELLRFSKQLLSDANPTTHGFNPDKARTTAGVSIAFSTASPTVELHFVADKQMHFAVYQNDVFQEIKRLKKGRSLKLNSAYGDETVEYRIAFPNFHNPIFAGLTLEDGHHLSKPPEARRKVFVALGDSITHGRGQNLSSQTWGWVAAEELKMELFNLAVGGSNANPWQPTSIAALPRVDLVTMLWGYNDWVNKGKTIEQFDEDMRSAIRVIRKTHPDTIIAVMQMLKTKSTLSKRTGDEFSADDFRKAAELIVESCRSNGDAHIHIIRSHTMTNTETHLADKVHLNVVGAEKLGMAMAVELGKILADEQLSD